jgi:hypothetical protein
MLICVEPDAEPGLDHPCDLRSPLEAIEVTNCSVSRYLRDQSVRNDCTGYESKKHAPIFWPFTYVFAFASKVRKLWRHGVSLHSRTNMALLIDFSAEPAISDMPRWVVEMPKRDEIRDIATRYKRVCGVGPGQKE